MLVFLGVCEICSGVMKLADRSHLSLAFSFIEIQVFFICSVIGKTAVYRGREEETERHERKMKNVLFRRLTTKPPGMHS